MQRLAGSSLRQAVRPSCQLSCRTTLRRGLSSPPNPPPTHKRLVTITVAFLAGTSFYFFLPDPTQAAPTLEKAPLSPRYFTPSTVSSNEESGPNTKLLRLSVSPEVIAASDPSGFRTIWSVFIKDDDIQVERPYTPLYGLDEHGQMLFWIKKYPKGEVGRWLHTKTPGEKIEFRAPLSTWNWKDDTWDEVVFISGGTGFAPFYQLFHSVISDPSISPATQFTLLHSSRIPQELPPTSLLKPLNDFAEKHPERLKVNLFVDAADDGPSSGLQVKRIDRPSIESAAGLVKPVASWWRKLYRQREPELPSKKRMFLVCGPEPMINAIAGPYGRNMSQGAIGGILADIGIKSDEVYKL